MDAREAITAVKALSSRANRTKLASILGQEAAEQFFGEIDQAEASELEGSLEEEERAWLREARSWWKTAASSGDPSLQ